VDNSQILFEFSDLKEVIYTNVSTQLNLINEKLDSEVVLKVGSSVESEDFSGIFRFAIFPFESDSERELLYWDSFRFNKFKQQAKDILLKYMNEIISLANNKLAKEISDVTPLLHQLMRELLLIAFPNEEDILSILSIGSIDYCDAKILSPKDNKTYIYNGRMDLALIFKRLNICLGGFENKVSKNSFYSNIDLSNLSHIGKKAVTQTGTQILGAAQKLKAYNLIVGVFTMMTTNAWQWVLVRRKSNIEGKFHYYHSNPISLAIQDKSKQMVAKLADDVSYDQVCNLLGLMFENVDNILQQAKVATLAVDVPRQTNKQEASSDHTKDNDSDSFGEKSKDQDKNEDSKSHPTLKDSNNVYKAGKNIETSNNNTSKQRGMLSFQDNVLNMFKFASLTSTNLKYHNEGY